MAIIKIEEATADQLRWYAVNVMGIDNLSSNPNTRKEILLQRIRDAGHLADSIEVADTPETPSGHAPVNPDAEEAAGMAAAGWVKIMIHTAGEGESNDDVFVAVNGTPILLPRGKEIMVKRPVVEALRNATRLVYPEQPDGGLGTPREVAQYPFSVYN